jgi:hypothetical protein
MATGGVGGGKVPEGWGKAGAAGEIEHAVGSAKFAHVTTSEPDVSKFVSGSPTAVTVVCSNAAAGRVRTLEGRKRASGSHRATAAKPWGEADDAELEKARKEARRWQVSIVSAGRPGGAGGGEKKAGAT